MYQEIVYSSVPNLPVHIGYSVNAREGSHCQNHYHDEIELLQMLSGKMNCIVGNKVLELKKGDVVFVNSRVPHWTCITEADSSNILVQVNTDSFSNHHISKYLSRFVNNNENPVVLLRAEDAATQKVCEYMNIIKDEYERKNLSYELFIKANIYNILALLYRRRILIDTESLFDLKTIEKVLPILDYIENNYQNQITLETVSSLLHINQQYFCRLFKKATNSTFTEYLNFVRVSKAEKLLSSTSKNVMEVSLDVGFSSVSYFNRIFKKFKSCTPTSYKKIKYAQT